MSKNTERNFNNILNHRRRIAKIDWVDDRGRSVPIDELTEDHIRNIIMYLTRRQKQFTEADRGVFMHRHLPAATWVEILDIELHLRNSESLTASTKTPIAELCDQLVKYVPSSCGRDLISQIRSVDAQQAQQAHRAA